MKKVEFMNYTGVEIVVARYQENVRWLESIPYKFYDRITVYNKGDEMNELLCKNLLIIPLKNVGRETHTYLTHIIQRYESLAPVTVFFHGSAYDTDQKRFNAIEILKRLKQGKKNFIYVNRGIDKDLYNFRILQWDSTCLINRLKNPNNKLTPSSIAPYGKWFEHHFPSENLPTPSYLGQFIVSKENIQKRPKDFYEHFLSELEVSDNPEVGHFFERTWVTLLHIPKEDILDLTPA